MSQNDSQIDVNQCRSRQQRLLAEMARLGIDLAIVTLSEHVEWLAGPRFTWFFSPCAALAIDGHLTLVAPTRTEVAAADEVAIYEAKRLSTLRNDQRQASAEVLLKALEHRPRPQRVGVEFSCCGPHWTGGLPAELVDIEPVLYQLRRQKHPDELARLRKAIAATGRMYEVARQIIEPGISELEVFNRLQATAVLEFGEMLTGTGNDYACGARGGPPRVRRAEAGELYILDLGPAFRGYFADNCRAIAVDRRPTDLQLEAWRKILPVFSLIERTVRPGKSCRELFYEAKAMLDSGPGVFDHHLGHGIGLFPHEAPHLNPNWDDTFQVNEVIAVEPGLYSPQMRAGIRLENNYLVTETGVELLSDFPLELA